MNVTSMLGANPDGSQSTTDTQDTTPALPEGEAGVPNTAAADQQQAQDGSTCVFRLRGLPFVATESDIATWASGLDVLESFIVRRNGRSTGEAYMTVPSAQSTEALKTLNKKFMGSRYIEIFEASAPDLEAVKALAADGRLRGFVIRLRGLPYSATASDVTKFLDGVAVAGGADGVVFTFTPDGRPTGEAYVELDDEDGQRSAMQRHKELMGSRYVEVFISSKADLLQAQQHNRFHFSQAALRRRWAAMGPVALALPAAAASAGMMGMGDHVGMMHQHAGGAMMGMQPYPVPYGCVQYGGQPMLQGPPQGPAALADAFKGLSMSPGGAPNMQRQQGGPPPGRAIYGPDDPSSSGAGAMQPGGIMQRHMQGPPPGTVFYPAPAGPSNGAGISGFPPGMRPGMERGSPQQQQQQQQQQQRRPLQQYGMPGADGGAHFKGFMPHMQQQQRPMQQQYMMLQPMPQGWGPVRPQMRPMHPGFMHNPNNPSSSSGTYLHSPSGAMMAPPAGPDTAPAPGIDALAAVAQQNVQQPLNEMAPDLSSRQHGLLGP